MGEKHFLYLDIMVVTKTRLFIFATLEYIAGTTWLNSFGCGNRSRKTPSFLPYPLPPLTIETCSVELCFP